MKQHKVPYITFVFPAAILATAASAQVATDGSKIGALITDRPDFTESTEAVPNGMIQIEAGYTFTYDDPGDGATRTQDHSMPEILLRVGLATNVELRLGWEGYSFTRDKFDDEKRTEFDWSQGAADTSVGVKVKLFEQEGWRPHFGIIGELSMPSGSTSASSGDVDPAIKLLWAYDIDDRLSIAGNMNIGVPTENGNRFVQAASSVSAAFAVTDELGTYIEYFGAYPASDGEDGAHTINGGFTYLLSPDLQLDIRAGAGLNEEADDFFVGAGFSWRF